jgi:hypothetical protein
MANVLMMGTPTVMTTNRHLSKHGQTSPPARHCRCSGVSLLCAIAYLGSLLCRDADLHPLTGSGLFLYMW